MKMTASDCFSLLLVFFGTYKVMTGKLEVEFGFTGANSGGRSRFIASKKRVFRGGGVRIFGVACMCLGVVMFFAIEAGEVLFSL